MKTAMNRILEFVIDVVLSTSFALAICIAVLLWTFFGAETTTGKLIGLVGFVLNGCWIGVTVLVIGVAKDGATMIAGMASEQDGSNN